METLSIRNVANASVFRQLMSQQTGWTNKPSDWSDIRKDCPADSIALYAGVKSDYSAYDNLGFTATCTGGYNVFIDGTQYGTTYASDSQCSITWSTSGITTGDDITTPSALKAHKIWVEPATSGNNITAFHCARVAASGTEQQGILWAHFNISNSIDATSMFGNTDNSFRQQVLQAITAKNNTLKIDTSASAFVRVCQSLTYLPVIDGQNNNLSNAFQTFADCPSLPNINVKNFASTILHATFRGARALNKLPKGIDYSVAVRMVDYLTNAVALEDTILDVSDATALKAIGCYGTSQYFMSGFKGLRVSSSAPFNYATSPQINVSYTGMDRAALVQLFNDLPSVSDGQIINVTGTTGSEDLTGADVLIATNKGWSVTGGPQPVQVYAYTDGDGNTIYAHSPSWLPKSRPQGQI